MTDAQQPGSEQRPVNVWPSRDFLKAADAASYSDVIAQEVPVALVYNGISHVVMMASPIQLEEFARGFSLTEGIVTGPEDIYAIDIAEQSLGVEVALRVSNRSFAQVKNRRRTLTGRSGCGLCGAESLEQVRQPLQPLTAQFTLPHSAIKLATSLLGEHQPLQDLSGAVHGAAWCDLNGHILAACEDVGRHNALDKLVGLLWADRAFQQPGFLLISSRASYEIVQKAAKAEIAVVVALSAPTSLAIDIAQETGITLIGFSRQDRHVTYANGHRLTEAS